MNRVGSTIFGQKAALVVDQDTRQLLLFGGEDIRFDVPLRRVYIELLGKVWKDWRVQWVR